MTTRTSAAMVTALMGPMAVVLMALMAATGCSSSEPTPANTALLPAHDGFLAIEALYDGSPSFVESIDPESHLLTQNSGVAFDDDPHLRQRVDPRDGRARVFIVGSSSGQLTELSDDGMILSHYSVSDESNHGDPLDVAIGPDGALWVTRYFARSLLVLDPGGAPRQAIDLSSHAPADGPKTGSPTMSAIAIVGNEAFVALRRLNADSQTTNTSQVVVLDVATGSEVASIDLPLSDPSDHFVVDHRQDGIWLWISCIGAPVTHDAVPYGLVAIDVATRTVVASIDLRSQGLFVSDFAIASPHEGYATVARYLDLDNPSMLVRFDPSTGVMGAPLESSDTYTLRGLALSGGLLLVTNWDAHAPGIDLFDLHQGAHLGRISTRLPPTEVVALPVRGGVPSP